MLKTLHEGGWGSIAVVKNDQFLSWVCGRT